MIDSIISLSNVRVAGAPTFFPGSEPKKHRCLLTVIKNRGKNTAGEEMTDEIGLVFWGKYAQTAALYLDKGRAINVTGVLRSHTKETGKVKANGKKELQRDISVHVKSFEFSADSKKELVKRIGQNIARAKQEGFLPPDCTITPEYLIAVSKSPAYDYNPETARQTGMYGNARVYDKGFLGSGTVTPVQSQSQNLEALQKELAEAKAEKDAAVAAMTASTVNPIPQA